MTAFSLAGSGRSVAMMSASSAAFFARSLPSLAMRSAFGKMSSFCGSVGFSSCLGRWSCSQHAAHSSAIHRRVHLLQTNICPYWSAPFAFGFSTRLYDTNHFKIISTMIAAFFPADGSSWIFTYNSLPSANGKVHGHITPRDTLATASGLVLRFAFLVCLRG